MNASILALLVLCSTFELSKVNAKPKSLKIIIPSKIRYVHHHHTHVVVMKDKKAQRVPDAKYHHLHYYDEAPRKNKGVHHYFIPVVQPQPDDEAEEESIAKYSVAPPKNRFYQNNNYLSARQMAPVYEEPAYPSYSRKYRIYERSSDHSIPPPQNGVEYYEADPFFAAVANHRDYINPGVEKLPPVDVDYTREALPLEPEYSSQRIYEGGPLFYPQKRFYPNSQKHIFIK